MPLFSIIIPTYNSEKTLSNTVDSILCQCFKSFEILIMDGGSKDNTLSIAQSYNDNRIKIFSEKDNGVYDAMNKGVEKASGEWFYFIGSDDQLYDENVLNDVACIAAKTLKKVLYGDVNSNVLGEKYDGEFSPKKLFNKNICHQAIFYHKDIFIEFGKYNLKYKVLADFEFNIRVLLNNFSQSLYLDRTIAFFYGGGMSCFVTDLVFKKDQNGLFKKYGLKSLPIRFLRYTADSRWDFVKLIIKRYTT